MNGERSLFKDFRKKRREARRVRRLDSAERRLRDGFHHWDTWVAGLSALSPSRVDRERAQLHSLIREVQALGGDPLDLAPFGDDHHVAEALPELFERRQTGHNHRWETHRV